ncbi:hypothetical protein L218DRAFT_629765 [Marasmius fiardii PR-910]|nr:hypothetical protein L218DRAFT_629765 [Marasmius fiardii PR-910]
MLPKGGTLKNLEQITEFQGRIQKYWRQWYEFAQRQGTLGENQTLFVVTGVEQCSTWAIAAWDQVPGNPTSESLSLVVDESDGRCLWSYPTTRCEMQSFTTISPPESTDTSVLKQTVFVRGFWINRIGGQMNSAFLPSMQFGGTDGGMDGDDNFGGSHDGGLYRSSSSNSSSLPSPFPPPSSGSAPASGGRYFDDPATQMDTGGSAHDPQVLNISAECLGLSDLMIIRPCEVINRFALEVVSRLNPEVPNIEFVVVSHDNDWISILDESDDSFPSKIEIIRRICSKFKFVVENAMIYTAKLENDDAELVKQSSASVPANPPSGVIPVFIEFRETDPTRPSQRVERGETSSAMDWSPAPSLVDIPPHNERGSDRDESGTSKPPVEKPRKGRRIVREGWKGWGSHRSERSVDKHTAPVRSSSFTQAQWPVYRRSRSSSIASSSSSTGPPHCYFPSRSPSPSMSMY